MKKEKLWGGRFSASAEKALEEFSCSLHFDKRLAAYDLQGSWAHAQTLARAEVLSADELRQIVDGLKRIREEVENGSFVWHAELEDVHTNIEARLCELIGDVGKKLHTGRSRNDQIATDLRLYLRKKVEIMQLAIRSLQSAILQRAEEEHASLMPGFTHLQIAQAITFGHHVMAWFEMLKRDFSRLDDSHKRINCLPLGSAALAGSGFALDRHHTAELLGFDEISDNSLDAVSDRDFAVELCADCALLMMHLSRMAEEIILWCSQPFLFVELPDSWCTGSSLMPQKKNPDALELVRGKSGRVYGDLIALLTIMKAQPLAYNRDNQEDKEPVFDAFDTSLACLRVMTGIISSMRVKRERLAEMAQMGYSTATDLADYLVRKGLPFRDAHALSGKIVCHAIEQGRHLWELPLSDLRQFYPGAGEELLGALRPAQSLNSKAGHGGTAPQQVMKRIRAAQRHINATPCKGGPSVTRIR